MFWFKEDSQFELLQKRYAKEAKRILALLPKKCICTACTQVHEDLKAKLGKSEYDAIINSLRA